MTVLSSLYGIIMDRSINSPGNGNDIVDVLNATDKLYLKEQMELLGKLEINDTSNIVIITSASKDLSVRFVYQCLHILNNKYRLNGLKVITKMKKIESLFKYQSLLYNIQSNNYVNQICIKLL